MKFTNKKNLPLPLFDALTVNNYDNGGSWRSVTELVGPAKIAHLKRRHADKIIEDAAERFYTFQGEIVHAAVERAAKKRQGEGWISEQRIFKEVRNKLISGAFDLYNSQSKHLYDIKYSTAWKALNGRVGSDWEGQINLLAHLLRTQGHEVNSASVILIMRDHSQKEADANPDYPLYPFEEMRVRLWKDELCEQFLFDRVDEHLRAEDGYPVRCTDEERWATESAWSIREKGKKRAVRGQTYKSLEPAKIQLALFGPKYEIIYKEGTSRRCAKYCKVNNFCDQFKSLSFGKTGVPAPSEILGNPARSVGGSITDHTEERTIQ